jgi:esterase
LDISLNHKIIGQGEPIVILHGLFGMLDNWLTIAKRLEDSGYMVILIDQRDHGRSPHTNRFDYPTLAEDLVQFLEQNWIYNAILIGHSMGGKTGLQMVSQHAELIKKFVCIDIGKKAYDHGHNEVFDALYAVDIKAVQSRGEVENILMSHLKDMGTVQFLMKNLSRSKEGGYEWKMNLDLLRRDYENILAKITFDAQCEVPTLFIRGGLSDYIIDQDIPDLMSSFTDGSLVTIDGAGHWVHVDKSDELFEQIITFIEG